MDEDETLRKFVENMRSTGLTDDMIAQNLIDAGHNRLAVLNLFGVSHIDELVDDEEDDETSEGAPEAVQSAYTLLDADGNPIISEDNQPRVIGEDPQPQSREHEATVDPPVDRTKPARERVYPRPKPRKAEVETTEKEHTKAQPTPEHHTYDDFMHRIEDHEELEAGDHHSLASGDKGKKAKQKAPPEENDSHELPKPLPAQDTKKHTAPKKEEAKSINELLEKQKDEAAEGPGGPDMDDLLDEKDRRELEEIEAPKKTATKEAVDLNKVPDTPEIEEIGASFANFQNSNTLKIILIALLVALLVIAAATIMLDIVG